jgi:hypothetical protein
LAGTCASARLHAVARSDVPLVFGEHTASTWAIVPSVKCRAYVRCGWYTTRMTRRLLPLLLLMACSGPAEYRRGTMPAPPPAPLRPGVGAPTMGQPGSLTQPPPRSPNKRVLPPSNEPGLYSADRPRASNSAETEAAPILYGIELPVPEKAGAVARFHAAMCARSLEDATRAAGKARLVEGLSRQQKACLALQLQDLCLLTVRGLLPQAQRSGLDALVDMTHAAVERECVGVAYGKGVMQKAFGDIGARVVREIDSRPWWRLQ